MTLNTIVKKLFKNNIRQYALFLFSIVFAVTMIGGYGVLQFSKTITNVLMNGGTSEMISLSMFGFTLIGTLIFIIYAHSIFLKYKSKEIGVFISLGIRRKDVRKIVIKELNIIFLIATFLGLILSIPIAWLSWSTLTLFIKTKETAFYIGWKGLLVAALFGALCMIITRCLTSRYVKKVDIIKILKVNDEIEEVNGDNFVLGLIGVIMIPAGIIMYTSRTLNRILGGVTSYSLIITLIGLYLFIVQFTTIGGLLKKTAPEYYYKHIVFFNLVKLKGKQYTLALFVSTILIGVSIFSVAFNAEPMISGMLMNYNDPYDYMVKAGFQQGDFGDRDINELAKTYNVQLKDFKKFDTLIMASFSKKYNEWSPINVVSDETVYKLTGKTLDVKPDCLMLVVSDNETTDPNNYSYLTQPEPIITLLNFTTKKQLTLDNKGIKCINKILSWDNKFGGKFFVVDTELFKKLYEEQKKEYKFTTYVFNTQNWKQTGNFSNALFDAIAKASGGKWCPNYDYGYKEPYEYKNINENISNTYRWWGFTPASRYHTFNEGISDFAVYLLLFIYISVISFVSAIMIIGIKILNTVWQDKGVYKNITFLGARQKEIKAIVSKQVALIYFVPVILGTTITLGLFNSMLSNGGSKYPSIVFLFACGLSLLVTLIQVALFFVIRKHAIKECLNFKDI
ncbi:FtsX-like permease family protein [Clostridium tagluense]|uniref:FtsX-like permease family protein n=1 Tax=Clostridium tagluense TaxID=360422 RepID=UPI001CF4AADA|nr:ABC transporter permease [Clostridium tagluense]MCB2299685.1 ABC transporter permease [Clostridium tagluense]